MRSDRGPAPRLRHAERSTFLQIIRKIERTRPALSGVAGSSFFSGHAIRASETRSRKSRLVSVSVENPSRRSQPVPVYRDRWGITEKVVKGEVIPRVVAVAKEKKLPVIDLYAALSDAKKLFPDGVHPNAEGAKIMASTIQAAIAPGGDTQE